MALPLTGENLSDYNNVPTTPVSDPLGTLLNTLYALIAGGGVPVYGEIYQTAGYVTVNVDNTGYQKLALFNTNGLSSGVTPDAADDELGVVAGRYRVRFQCSRIRAVEPATDVAILLAFGVDGVAVTNTLWIVSDNEPSTQTVSMEAIIDVAAAGVLSIMGLGVDVPPGIDNEYYNPRLQAFRLGDIP